MDYLDNNRLIAHYCGVNIMELLPAVALAAVLHGSHSYRASKSFRRGALSALSYGFFARLSSGPGFYALFSLPGDSRFFALFALLF